ncbi:MAG: isopenicillin-N epimerase [Micromonosporaceae bacterium]
MAYLNHGMVGVAPIAVLRAQQRLRDEMEGNPARFFARGLRDRIAHARRHLAAGLGADPEGSALVTNASTGISTALAAVALGPGDEVLTTDHGHGAVRLAVERSAAAAGARHVTASIPLEATDAEIVDAILDRTRAGRTRLAIVDMISSPTARLFPVGRLATELRRVGACLLVDGAHAPGSLTLHVDDIGADFFVGNLHKWAYAPRGTALLSVAPRWRQSTRGLVVSSAEPAGFPGSVEFAATQDYTGWLAAPTGLYVLRTLGAERVRAHNAALARYGQRVVGEALGLDPDHLPDPGGPVPMRVVPLPVASGTDPVVLRDRISDELATEVAVHAWQGRLLLRLSAQVYNRPEEYERLAEGLPALVKPLR